MAGESYNVPKLINIGVLGDKDTGKTSLILRFLQNSYSENQHHSMPKKSVTVKKSVNNKNIVLQIFDTPPNVARDIATKEAMRYSDSLLLVFDITNKESFKNLKLYLEEIRHYANEFKLHQVILVGTKSDLAKTQKVSREDIEKFLSTQSANFNFDDADFPLFFYEEVSAKKNLNVHQLFLKAAGYVVMPSAPSPSYEANDNLQDKCINTIIKHKVPYEALPQILKDRFAPTKDEVAAYNAELKKAKIDDYVLNLRKEREFEENRLASHWGNTPFSKVYPGKEPYGFYSKLANLQIRWDVKLLRAGEFKRAFDLYAKRTLHNNLFFKNKEVSILNKMIQKMRPEKIYELLVLLKENKSTNLHLKEVFSTLSNLKNQGYDPNKENPFNRLRFSNIPTPSKNVTIKRFS